MGTRHHQEVTVATVAYRWGASTMEDGAMRERVETAFSLRVNARAQQLGGDPRSIKSRVLGDVARARLALGESSLLIWT